MTKRKVIEDSDDDGDNAEAIAPPESTPATSEQNPTTMTEDGGSMTADILHTSASPSTACTERLNNEIRTAHKALIEPTPDSSFPSTRVFESPQRLSQASRAAARNELRRTKTSVETSKKRKGLKTYGSQGQDIYQFSGGSDGESGTPHEHLEMRAMKRLKSYAAVDGCNIGNGLVLGVGDAEAIGVKTSYTDKHPCMESSMPAPATRPISFEQTQRSETSTVAMVQGSSHATSKCTEAANFFEPSYSAGRMPTPTISSPGRGDEASTTGLGSLSSSRDRSRAKNEFSQFEQPIPAESGPNLPETSPGKNTSVDTKTWPTTFSRNIRQLEVSEFPTTKPIVLLSQLQNGDDSQDELSLAMSTSGNTSRSHAKPLSDNDQSPKHVDELGSFHHTTIDIPTELYRPRPSKSRSGRENSQIIIPADYSKRPETVAKKNRKLSRRNTTAFHELVSKEECANDVVDIGIMTRPGFGNPSPKATELIKEQDELGIEENEKAEEIYKDSRPEDTSMAKPTVLITQIAGPRSGVDEATEDNFKIRSEPCHEKNGRADGEEDTDADPAPKVELKAPTKSNDSKKPRGRPKKGAAESSNIKPRGKAQDEPAHNDSSPLNNETVSLGRKSRKQGVASETFKAVSEELIHDSDDEPLAADGSEGVSKKTLCETQGNVILPTSIEDAPGSTSPAKPISDAPETPQKAAAPHKCPDKHSPISSGKVAYRVGLSKRARIEPLLRIVRKH